MDVQHDESRKRFFVPFGDDEAYVSYQMDGSVIEFQHTIVPEEEEGKGVGSALARHALEHAREKNLRVQPTCAFIRAYLERHEEYRDLVVE